VMRERRQRHGCGKHGRKGNGEKCSFHARSSSGNRLS
jgi:hypothetical protein